MKTLRQHYFYVPQMVALLIAAPLAWMAFDRTPPLVLHDGVMTPSVVRAGQQNVKLVWRATYSGRDCPGLSQREFVDANRGLWPQLAHQRAGIFMPDSNNPLEGTVEVPPLAIPEMMPGTGSYQVTQVYFCNWLQRVLRWPIVKTSPYVNFVVAP